MLKTRLTILVSTLVIPLRRVFVPVVIVVIGAGLAACGQTGQLYLPKKNDPAAAHRASLPQSLWPFMPSKKKEDNKQPQADDSATTEDDTETWQNDDNFDPLPEEP